MEYQLDKNSMKLAIESCQQKIFALTLYLVGGDRNKAYDVAAAGFAEALQTASPLEDESTLMVRAVRSVIERSRDTKAIPFFDDADFADLPRPKREPLRLMKKALLGLDLDTKAPLLLRDQAHLSYKEISAILEVPEKEARIRTTQARVQLRNKLDEVLRHGG
ncbi:MAG: sigma factor-like helix-turn-helix DNA-binding protein [Candidatus Omnitrophota bacterium]